MSYSMTHKEKLIAAVIAVILTAIACYYLHYASYTRGYKTGYDAGYAEAVRAATAQRETAQRDTVTAHTAVTTTTTTTVRPRQTASEPAVQVVTEAPKIVAAVNGKKYEFKPESEILQTGVKTTAAISVRIPERKWSIGLGTDGRKAAYMLKAPIGKSAVGVWVAGSGKHKIMGGVSISF